MKMLSHSAIAAQIFPISILPPPPPLKTYDPKDATPAARFTAKIHQREPEVSAEVNGFFLTHWDFESEKARKKFVAAGFPRVTCLYYPLALADRISFACRLLTLLFLIDGRFQNIHKAGLFV